MTTTPVETLQLSDPIPPQAETSAEEVRMYSRFGWGPAWRWRTSISTVARGYVVADVEHGSIFWQIVDYLRGASFEARTKYRGDRLLDIAAAETIFHDPNMRLQVEARLLARLSPDVVASRSGLATRTVLDYCDVFFDVLDSLHARSWLACYVFDRDGEPASDLHHLVCRDSYDGGPEVCEHWLKRIPHLDEDCDLATSKGREIKRLQRAVALHNVQMNDPNRLCELVLRVDDIFLCQSSHFDSLSSMLGKRTAHLLSKYLSSEEDAQPIVREEADSHTQPGDRRRSA